jgi:hypothetical protein
LKLIMFHHRISVHCLCDKSCPWGLVKQYPLYINGYYNVIVHIDQQTHIMNWPGNCHCRNVAVCNMHSSAVLCSVSISVVAERCILGKIVTRARKSELNQNNGLYGWRTKVGCFGRKRL